MAPGAPRRRDIDQARDGSELLARTPFEPKISRTDRKSHIDSLLSSSELVCELSYRRDLMDEPNIRAQLCSAIQGQMEALHQLFKDPAVGRNALEAFRHLESAESATNCIEVAQESFEDGVRRLGSTMNPPAQARMEEGLKRLRDISMLNLRRKIGEAIAAASDQTAIVVAALGSPTASPTPGSLLTLQRELANCGRRDFGWSSEEQLLFKAAIEAQTRALAPLLCDLVRGEMAQSAFIECCALKRVLEAVQETWSAHEQLVRERESKGRAPKRASVDELVARRERTMSKLKSVSAWHISNLAKLIKALELSVR